jgi:hypothetical protein
LDDLITAIVTKLACKGVNTQKQIVVVRVENIEPSQILLSTVKRVLLDDTEGIRIVLAVGINAVTAATSAAMQRSTEILTTKLQLLGRRWGDIKEKHLQKAAAATTAGSNSAAASPMKTARADAATRMEAYAKINSTYRPPGSSTPVKTITASGSTVISKPIECTGTYEVRFDEDKEDACMAAGTQRNRRGSRSNSVASDQDEVTVIPAFVNCVSLLEIKALVPMFADSWANITLEALKDAVGNSPSTAAATPSTVTAVSPQRTSSAAPAVNGAVTTPDGRFGARKADHNPITQADMVSVLIQRY